MKTTEVEVIIIGAGTAGLSARREVARHTDSYRVIDDGPLGTTCARVGCMPSKVLIQVAEDVHRASHLDSVGVSGGDGLQVHPEQVMEHVRNLRDRFVRSVRKGMESWEETHLVRGRARFTGPNTLVVGDEEFRFRRAIIATGTSPFVPAPWQAFQSWFVDTNRFFEQATLPRRVGVIGMGVIGLELAQAMARLGVQVEAITLDKAYGGLSDPELQEKAHHALEREFPIHLSGVAGFEEMPDGLIIRLENGHQVEVDQVLLAVGRKPNLAAMGLEHVPGDRENGAPVVERGTMRWSGSDVYLAGDVNGFRPVLHEAADQGRIAGSNAVRPTDHCFQARTPLFIAFSDPGIARVGMSWGEFRESESDGVVGRVSYEGQGRAIVQRKEAGGLHLYAEKGTGRLLGAEMVAPDAEHLAHLLAWAIDRGWTAEETLTLPFYHPVTAEGVRTALRDVVHQVSSGTRSWEIRPCD